MASERYPAAVPVTHPTLLELPALPVADGAALRRGEALAQTRPLPGRRMARLAACELLTMAVEIAETVAAANGLVRYCVRSQIWGEGGPMQVTIRLRRGGWYVVTLDERKGGV
jgi:hypothetical protein